MVNDKVAEIERHAGKIKLTEAEVELLKSIELDALMLDHDTAERNGQAVSKLMKSLISRKAIPDQRARYMTDPDCKPGRLKGSRMDIFARNGNTVEETFRHPHFLVYLRYIVFGADLPSVVIRQFCRAVANCGQVSSGDVEDLRKTVRSLTRSHRLVPHEASEEFYKLALDCGLNSHFADALRRAVLQVR